MAARTGDADATATALRRVPEIGLDAGFVELAGYLPPHAVVTGFVVTPVVASFAGLRAAAGSGGGRRVSVPLAFCWNRYLETVPREYRGVTITSYAWKYGGHRIWGATRIC